MATLRIWARKLWFPKTFSPVFMESPAHLHLNSKKYNVMKNTITLSLCFTEGFFPWVKVGMLCLIILVAMPTFGQTSQPASKERSGLNQTFTGRVLDQGEPLPGANIYSVSTENGTVTDTDGYFTLTGVESGELFICSFIGYESKEFIIPENPSQLIEIQMEGQIVWTGSLQVAMTEKPGFFKKMKHTIAGLF